MNIKNIISEIEKVDPEVYGRLDTRRHAMKEFAGLAGKLALLSVPVALGGMFKKAYAGNNRVQTLFDVLNFALTLEYLEAKFYQLGNAAATAGTLAIPAGAPRMAIQTIGAHETAHVNFLKSAITSSGGTPVAEPVFDFSAGNGTGTGPFAGVFTNYPLFLAVAQTFEDTGVRAYKGQAADPDLMANNDVLQYALRIHSVEARHAAHIRLMRKANGGLVPAGVDVKPWITGKQSGIASTAVQASYDGEEVTNQAGVEIVNINSQAISANAASEAFDEPLTKAQVLAIVDPFIV
ncbi:MAG: ferritin-like domain-containing protein [Chitinophagaceae bacterium]|nr:ferritin-like domain-containing protein [Chitinophagaceae bacterium]